MAVDHTVRAPRTPSIRRGSQLAEQIYQTLLTEIVSGQLQPGEPLVEANLTSRFNVSRTPLREVLRRLAERRLVDIYPQVGSFVAPVQHSLVMDAQFIRIHLECALARQAAQKISDPTRLQLRHSLQIQEAAIAQNLLQKFYEADEQFHRLIATIADHPDIWDLIEQHKVHLDRVRHYALRSLGKAPSVLTQHKTIADAICSGSPEQAEQAMRLHLEGIHTSLDSWLSAATMKNANMN